jgi:Skp family chaperone for outer membrane proteins
MAVMMARDSWTDERLDDLKATVDAGFAEMRTEFRTMRAELKQMRAEFQEESRKQRVEFQEDMRELRTGMGETQRLILQAGAALWSTSMIGFLGILATIITKF